VQSTKIVDHWLVQCVKFICDVCLSLLSNVHSFLNQMHYNIHTFSKFVRFKKEYYKHICRNTQISTPFKSVKKC
jgi:hypothetical protein